MQSDSGTDDFGPTGRDIHVISIPMKRLFNQFLCILQVWGGKGK